MRKHLGEKASSSNPLSYEPLMHPDARTSGAFVREIHLWFIAPYHLLSSLLCPVTKEEVDAMRETIKNIQRVILEQLQSSAKRSVMKDIIGRLFKLRAKKFQGIEEKHIRRLKEIIRSYSQCIQETHEDIGEVHNKFMKNTDSKTVESLMQRLGERIATGRGRPGANTWEFILNIQANGCVSQDPFGPISEVSSPVLSPTGVRAKIDGPLLPFRRNHTAGLFGVPVVGSLSLPELSSCSLTSAAPVTGAESSSLPPTVSLSSCSALAIGSMVASSTIPAITVSITESVDAYFSSADPTRCLVKITGRVTLSLPHDIVEVLSSRPFPAEMSFKLKNTSRLQQIVPNQPMAYRDPFQNDPNICSLNMQKLLAHLRREAKQSSSASDFNMDILKYQVSSNGIQSTPLKMAVNWKCSPSRTDLRVDFRYNSEAMLSPACLSDVRVLVPVDGGVTSMQSQPAAQWNGDLNKALWNLSDISGMTENEGSGSLVAMFELSEGPTNPATLAVQFHSEGSTLSGVDVELVGRGYRLAEVKKGFATDRYMAGC
ncbi:F-BAR domain only protein 2-like [Megalops cyprinoides]|uniref:F-BAR domain only protein 2-like n=1 Tax=Megalops cyprinoides TaxID=118141 RepID=UPI0018653FE3|nr:F-BAR domain only protein 2-like [Megalops cyprinoides]